MTSSMLEEDIVEDEEMKKGRRMLEVQNQENPKKTPKKSYQSVRDGCKRRPSKQVAICTKRKDGEMPNEKEMV